MRILLLYLLLGSVSVSAQSPAANLNEALVTMAHRAGVIFAGHVLSVQHKTGFVAVQFGVDEAVRGCDAGEIYTLREWDGLWAGQGSRYTSGQRSLMLLYAPGPAGISSPVNGQSGVIPLAGSAVDLRWVAATGVGVGRASPVHSGPGGLLTRQSGPTQPLSASYLAVMSLLRTAVGLPVVHPISRRIGLNSLPRVER